MKVLSKLWLDEAGFIVSSELILLATIVVIGLIAVMTTVRDQVSLELADIADAISEVNQSYSYSGATSHSGSTAGAMFLDLPDFCETGSGAVDNDQDGTTTQCLD